MFGKEDNSYDEIREQSIRQWLEDMSKHEDITVRGGVAVTKAYLDNLKSKIEMLENKNSVKDKYLKKLKNKK
mgnify:CR=1 FL=1